MAVALSCPERVGVHFAAELLWFRYSLAIDALEFSDRQLQRVSDWCPHVGGPSSGPNYESARRIALMVYWLNAHLGRLCTAVSSKSAPWCAFRQEARAPFSQGLLPPVSRALAGWLLPAT